MNPQKKCLECDYWKTKCYLTKIMTVEKNWGMPIDVKIKFCPNCGRKIRGEKLFANHRNGSGNHLIESVGECKRREEREKEVEKEECGDCDGTGYIYDAEGHKKVCPICRGTGYERS